jgi:hypothetical protein
MKSGRELRVTSLRKRPVRLTSHNRRREKGNPRGVLPGQRRSGQPNRASMQPGVGHFFGERLHETDASTDTLAQPSRKTWLYEDLVEVDVTQSSSGSGRRKPD